MTAAAADGILLLLKFNKLDFWMLEFISFQFSTSHHTTQGRAGQGRAGQVPQLQYYKLAPLELSVRKHTLPDRAQPNRQFEKLVTAVSVLMDSNEGATSKPSSSSMVNATSAPSRPAAVAIVGSANMDIVCYVNRVPGPGVTLQGDSYVTGFGGKGANQAIMASRFGCEVHFIGSVGDDGFGHQIIENFKEAGIEAESLELSQSSNTGVAHIWVEKENGENRIVIIPGANLEIDKAKAVHAIESINDLKVVLGQCEIKQDVTLAAFQAAKQRGCVTILNPAPYQALSKELLSLTDWLIPNESEFEQLHPEKKFPSADDILQTIRASGNTIVTLGAEGAAIIKGDDKSVHRVPSPKVKSVDTTGAGDCFCGSFASLLASGLNCEDAVTMACIAASVSVTRYGAQASYPTQLELKTMFLI